MFDRVLNAPLVFYEIASLESPLLEVYFIKIVGCVSTTLLQDFSGIL